MYTARKNEKYHQVRNTIAPRCTVTREKPKLRLNAISFKCTFQCLRNATSNVYMKWKVIRIVLDKLEKQLSKYSEYLAKKNDDVQEAHSRTSINPEDDMDVLPAKVTINSTLKSRYSRLSEALARASEKSHKCGRFYAN